MHFFSAYYRIAEGVPASIRPDTCVHTNPGREEQAPKCSLIGDDDGTAPHSSLHTIKRLRLLRREQRRHKGDETSLGAVGLKGEHNYIC